MPKHVVDRDLGWDAIFAKVKEDAGEAFVKVGIQQDSVRQAEGGKPPADMVQIAAFQEFGTKNIPERSFIRGWYDSAVPTIQRLIQRLALQYIDGKITMTVLLAKLGNFAQGGMRKYLRNLKEPPNAPSTVRRKGSSNPLIDTGQLLAFIHYIAVKRGLEVGRSVT